MFQTYNTFQYNAAMYNATVLNLAFSETQGSSDTGITPFTADILRQETQSFSDAVTKLLDKGALSELVLLGGSLITQSDIVVFNTVLLVEQTMTAALFRTLTESQSSTDAVILTLDKFLPDTAFIGDTVRREITNKALPETVKVNVWLTVERKPSVSLWEG